MLANESKTKIMELNSDSNITFKINNQIIEKLPRIKYLGFIIDKELKFRNLIDYICKLIRNQVTMIKSHFEYGSSILFTCCTAHKIERLRKLQNRPMKIILKVNRYISIHFMLESLKWLNVQQRLKLNTSLCE